MCGIIGCNFRYESIDKALNLLRDRGPDFAGKFISDKASLGHTRLSIIDLSSHANQPMSYDKNFGILPFDESISYTQNNYNSNFHQSFTSKNSKISTEKTDPKIKINQTYQNNTIKIVFNGEIYNYKELANELKVSISSDTEILLHLYARFGTNFLHKLNGMFAFVIFDEQKNLFFGARDTFGKKPLYYYLNNGKFIFSSKINGILSLLNFTPEMNRNAIDSYLSFMSPLGSETFYQNIFKLEPASFFTYQNGEFKTCKFNSLDGLETLSLDFQTAQNLTRQKLIESIRLRLISDVPISFLLSGGVDSSTICGIYKKEFGKTPQTFSLGYNEYKNYDETPEAQVVAKFIGSNHHRVELSKHDFWEIFDKFYDFVDEPLADSATIPTFHLSREIHKNGYKVALSGEGSDECFLGYDLYFRVLEFYRSNLLKEAYPPISKDYEHLRRKELGLPIYASAGEVFTQFQKEHLLKNYCYKEPTQNYKNSFNELKQMSYMDFRIWVSEVLTTKIDRASMANSLEIRSPFLDINLVKFALSLPDNIRHDPALNETLGQNKQLLKSIALSYIPESIVKRKKKGFSSPFIEWIFDEMGSGVVDEILKINRLAPLLDENFVKILYTKVTKGRFKQHLWTLLCLSRWAIKRYGI